MKYRLDPLAVSGLSPATSSQIVVKQGGGAVHTGAKVLSDLANVDTSGATDNQALSYDSSSSKWIPQTVSGGGAVNSVNGQTGTVVLDADDISDTSTTNKFVTASDITTLSNTSGTNTGDQDLSGKQDILSEGAFVNGDKTKLDGIATGATANDTDANLKNRANHTGTQTASTISDFDTEVANNSAVTANTAKVTNATHTGEVTGSGALTIADNVVDEANLKVDNSPTDDYVLTAKSSASGGLTWKAASGGGGSGDVTAASSFGTDNAIIRADGTGKGVQSSKVTIDDTTGKIASVASSTWELQAANEKTIEVSGGDSSSATAAGDAILLGGTNTSTGDAGSVYLAGGASGGIPGYVILGYNPTESLVTSVAIYGSSFNYGELSMESLTSTRRFTFPDATTTLVGHDNTQTLSNKTLTTPTIGSFANAGHDHTNAAGGSQLTATTALDATGTPSSSTYLRGDNTWAAVSGSGDMLASTYDPNTVAGDAFNQDNMVDGTTNKNYTATEKTKLSNIEANADVTDTANVTSAGALMDSELTSITDVKALNQSVVSGASPVFTTTNMTAGTNKNFVTDAEAVVIGNTSGTNTGDQTSVTGNAGTATTLATSRTFRTNLASTSTASFDGSTNVTPGVTGTLAVGNGGTGTTTSTGTGATVRGTSPSLTTPTIAQINNSTAPGVKLQQRIQTDNSGSITNTTQAGVFTQMGWGQVRPSGAAATVSESVTFPTAFSTVLGVMVVSGGGFTGSDVSNITGLGSAYANDAGINAQWSSVTNSGFTVTLGRSSGSFGTAATYGYSWIAWGV